MDMNMDIDIDIDDIHTYIYVYIYIYSELAKIFLQLWVHKTAFIILLLFINYGFMFHMNNCKLILVHPVYTYIYITVPLLLPQFSVNSPRAWSLLASPVVLVSINI